MEEVKQDFLESLKDLTFNSRPIIQGLTEIAAECSEYGQGVAEAIEYHLSTCPPQLKIPTLYLMDSILKNVGGPYVELFAPKVYRMITESYRHIPGQQKQKLIDLFRSWTVPQPKTGSPVFSDAILSSIDSFFRQTVQSQPATQQVRLNQSSVQVEINQMLKFLKTCPRDKETEYQIGVLQRLQASISGAVDQQALQQAQQQIDNFKGRQENLLRKRQNQRGPRDRGDKRKKPYSRENGRDGGDSPWATGANSVPIRERAPKANDDGLSGLPDFLSNLKGSGLLSSSSGAAVSTPPPNVPESNEHQHSSISIKVELTNASLSTPHTELIAQLYSAIPLQCSVCGKRFPDTPEGQREKEDELDWHFRVNKDIRDGRSHSRMWFLTASQWVDYDESEPQEVEEEPKIDFEAEALKSIPIPDDHDGICHICQEKFNTVWSEDHEEWVYQNAVEVDSHIFHATCYVDPNNKAAIERVLAIKQE